MLKNCSALTRTIAFDEDDNLRTRMRKSFEPIVMPQMHDSFFSKWADFFVLENVVEQNRKPGLLKGLCTDRMIITIIK